jgi:hypothetical protein
MQLQAPNLHIPLGLLFILAAIFAFGLEVPLVSVNQIASGANCTAEFVTLNFDLPSVSHRNMIGLLVTSHYAFGMEQVLLETTWI